MDVLLREVGVPCSIRLTGEEFHENNSAVLLESTGREPRTACNASLADIPGLAALVSNAVPVRRADLLQAFKDS